ncbi:hypothetical protein RchiOBHm_Chr1g0326181 [Rosa chinensis]|uniref:Uncharacterized protein n=1 Tax=Rosa chinensis TaxID=74649 RepID=A0A2P6SA88_ROSCH|nr:hypothetical protein RchiOBHm_Chr1g0326181 [Rosa chinensis]
MSLLSNLQSILGYTTVIDENSTPSSTQNSKVQTSNSGQDHRRCHRQCVRYPALLWAQSAYSFHLCEIFESVIGSFGIERELLGQFRLISRKGSRMVSDVELLLRQNDLYFEERRMDSSVCTRNWTKYPKSETKLSLGEHSNFRAVS